MTLTSPLTPESRRQLWDDAASSGSLTRNGMSKTNPPTSITEEEMILMVMEGAHPDCSMWFWWQTLRKVCTPERLAEIMALDRSARPYQTSIFCAWYWTNKPEEES